MKKIDLSSDEIHNKNFTICNEGYKMEEVNDFMDQIVAYCDSLEKETNDLKEKNQLIEKEKQEANVKNKQLETDLANTHDKLASNLKGDLSNLDIVTRFSNMESAIFALSNKFESLIKSLEEDKKK